MAVGAIGRNVLLTIDPHITRDRTEGADLPLEYMSDVREVHFQAMFRLVDRERHVGEGLSVTEVVDGCSISRCHQDVVFTILIR